MGEWLLRNRENCEEESGGTEADKIRGLHEPEEIKKERLIYSASPSNFWVFPGSWFSPRKIGENVIFFHFIVFPDWSVGSTVSSSKSSSWDKKISGREKRLNYGESHGPRHFLLQKTCWQVLRMTMPIAAEASNCEENFLAAQQSLFFLHFLYPPSLDDLFSFCFVLSLPFRRDPSMDKNQGSKLFSRPIKLASMLT